MSSSQNENRPQPTIGFIGVGIMGRGMVANLLKAGFPVNIFARNPEKVDIQNALRAGAKLSVSVRELSAASDIIITMLPRSNDVSLVVLDSAEGVLSGARPGSVVVDMSTISPAVSRQVAEGCLAKGIGFLDAPVSGGATGAEAGTLTIMASGEQTSFEKCRTAFEAMGRSEAIFHVGPYVGTGEVIKIVNNMLGGIIAAACAQALTMGVKAGADLAVMAEVVNKSSGASWQLANAFPRNVYSGAFQPGFFAELMHKDLGLAVELGETAGVPVSLAREAQELYTAALEAGYNQADYTAVIRPMEAAAGVEVRLPAKSSRA